MFVWCLTYVWLYMNFLRQIVKDESGPRALDIFLAHVYMTLSFNAKVKPLIWGFCSYHYTIDKYFVKYKHPQSKNKRNVWVSS